MTAKPPWIDRLARSRFAVVAMGTLSFLDACVSPILPEIILVPLCLARSDRRHTYAWIATAASVLGGICGYLLGRTLWNSGLSEFAYRYLPGFTPESFQSVSDHFGEHAFLWMFLAAFTPLPFKLFTVSAGACHESVSLMTLITASIIGRGLRFWLTVEVLYRAGPAFVSLMQKRGGQIAVAVIALILLFFLIAR